MELTVAVSDLRDALVAARHATPANPAVVAYSGVLLKADSSTLTVTGFDGDFCVRAVTAADVTTAGQFLVQPRPLAAYLSTLPDDVSCTLGVDGVDLTLAVPGGRPYRFRAVTAAFPAPPACAATPVEVNFSRFALALGAVRTAVAKDPAVVQLVSDTDGLTLHATDNYRLAKSHLPEAGFGEFTGLVPLAVLERAARLHVRSVQVDPAARIVVFDCGPVTLTTRLVVGTEFPAVHGVLAAVPPTRVRIPAADTLRALAPLAALTESSSELSPVTVTIDGPLMTIAASNADTGSGVEEVSLPVAIAAPFSFQVRLPYLREALSGLTAGELTLAFSSPHQPLYLLTDAPVATTVVVMPVRG